MVTEVLVQRMDLLHYCITHQNESFPHSLCDARTKINSSAVYIHTPTIANSDLLN